MKENLMTVKTAIAAAGTALGAFLGWKGVMLMAWALCWLVALVTALSGARYLWDNRQFINTAK